MARRPRKLRTPAEARRRLIACANMWAMDWVMDGGTLPPRIETMQHAGHVSTPADEDALIDWFNRTAPGDFCL
jgi:hypothetical protein